MACEADGWYLCANESQDLNTDQPTTDKVADHTQYCEPAYPGSRHRCRPVLRMRRILAYAGRRPAICLREYSRWLRWRGRAAQAPGVRLRLLAGDRLRLSILLVYLRWNDDRTREELGCENISCLGSGTSFWSSYKFPGYRTWTSSTCYRTP